MITYCYHRSGSHFLSNNLSCYLSTLSSDRYIKLSEFFNARSKQHRFIVRNGNIIALRKKKSNNLKEFRWKWIYKDGCIIKERIYGPCNFNEKLELLCLMKIWDKSKNDNNRYHFNLFSSHFSFKFMTILNNSVTFFMVLLRREFRKTYLSGYIANDVEKYVYLPTDDKHIFPEKSSINIDIKKLKCRLIKREDFYKNLNKLNNKYIISYDDLDNPEIMADLMQHIYVEDIWESMDRESFKQIHESMPTRHIPTPYTMERIDYIENKDEVLMCFEKFDEINDHYMNLYGIK